MITFGRRSHERRHRAIPLFYLVEPRGTRMPRPSVHAHKGLILVKPPLGHPAMATRLLCCVALCLLGREFIDAGVIQTPRHNVTKMGQEVTLKCQPISGHAALYWYSQTSVQGPKLLIYFNNQAPIDDSGMPKERFSAEISNKSLSTLKIKPTEPGDSATYLCASSVDTELHSHPLPVQKPSSFLFPLQPPAVLSSLSKVLPCQYKDMGLVFSVYLGIARTDTFQVSQ
uniref:Ig-like domain-containing protein n=1 Tax=Mustela putorius furo TaxID=9669 RepID=M3YAY8_MUSPF